MRIYLSGISEEPKTLDFSLADAWLVQSIQHVQESEAPPTDAHLSVDVYKSQDLIILDGDFTGTLELLCSRCADPFDQRLTAHFKCLFTRDKTLTESESLSGSASETEDVDIEFLDKEHIELADVMREQLYLKIPFQPLCNENCKGLCTVCGQNQNSEPCQCHRIPNGPMAQALRNIRLNKQQAR